MQNLASLLKILKKYKKEVILGATLIIFESITELFLPIFMSHIINEGIGRNDIKYTILMIILMSITTLIGMIGGIFSTYYSSKASGSMSYEIRNSIITKISKTSFKTLNNIKIPQIVTIMNNDIPIVENIVNMGIRILIRLPIILIGSVCLSILLSPKLSLLLLLIIPIMVIIMYIIMKKVFPYFDITQSQIDEANSIIRQNIGGVKTIKSFRKEKTEIKKFNKTNNKLKNINIKAISMLSYAMPSMMLIINITTILILWIGGNEVISKNFEIGNIMALIQYLTSILSAIMSASLILVMIAKSEISAKRINDIFKLDEDLKGGKLIPKLTGKIEFKNVSFEYEKGKGDYVLKNINLVINPGEHVGIIGVTGSGKTSLINLIPRYYDVCKGEILIDNINVKKYNINHLRKKIKICMQKAELFSGTILSNIKDGHIKLSMDKINEILKIVELQKFVKDRKEGIKAKVEQDGKNLSGGEKQRLNLARTLASNPDVIILDDVTRSLDLKTDKKIRNNLEKYLKNKTLIVISSRLSSIIDFDKIIVVNDGMIDNIGTHDYLLKNSKIYKEIYDSQFIGGELNG